MAIDSAKDVYFLNKKKNLELEREIFERQLKKLEDTEKRQGEHIHSW